MSFKVYTKYMTHIHTCRVYIYPSLVEYTYIYIPKVYMSCIHICLHSRHTATYTETLSATHYITLHHTATHCNALQHTATHCNTLQHSATHCNTCHTCRVYRIRYTYHVCMSPLYRVPHVVCMGWGGYD